MGAWVLRASGLAGLGLFLGAQVGVGQSITLDGTLGPVGTLTGPVYVIPQGVGTTVGTNLFHSFGRFNLATGERANFQSAVAIRNILARVTGGGASSIDGLIFTNSPAVNLFLLNPSGIVFGPNARLDIGGTTRGDFTATTLDAIVWPDGSQFDAVNPGRSQSLLRIVGDPSGFSASQRQIPGIIVNQSRLQVYDTQDLRLLGGNVSVTRGDLDAWGGRIDVGAVRGAGTVGLLGNGSFLFPSDLARGDVQFTNGSFVDVALGAGGDVTVTGRDIGVFAGSTLKAGIDQNFGTPTSQAGLLRLDATETITVAGNLSNVQNSVGLGARGRGGNVEIQARNVVVRDNAQLSASTFGVGNAGNIQITASNRTLFQTGASAFSDVEVAAVGQGGNIIINTGVLEVRGGSQLLTNSYGRGNSGNIRISARDNVLFQGASNNGLFSSAAGSKIEATGRGQGGDVIIETNVLEVLDRAQLSSSTNGLGNSGSVRISTRDRTLFQNGGAAFSGVDILGAGKGGDIVINTAILEVRGAGQLSANTSGQGDAGNIKITARDQVLFQGRSADGRFGSNAFSRVEITGRGNGGDVVINTAILEVRDGAQLISNTRGQGNAGNVRINASDRVIFQNRSVASSGVEFFGRGKGGEVAIDTATLEVRDGAQISADTRGQGNAGNIRLNVRDRILFQGFSSDANLPSLASSRVDSTGTGTGGDVLVNTATLEVREGAQILANSRGEGNAGKVIIHASDRVLVDGTSVTNGRSSLIFTNNGTLGGTVGTGTAGTVFLSTPQLTVSNGGVISASTINDQPGGDITLNLGSLQLLGGGQILSTSSNRGPAATILINTTDGIRIAGNDPTYVDRLARFTTAVAPITPNSGIYVRSIATGAAGNIIIGDQGTTPRLILDGGEIIADSNSVDGGNIILNLDQALVMRNGSLISATAGRAQGAGDGGNITITAPFVLSQPGENNDIIANAFSGTGGNITIDAEAILNFTLNDRQPFDTLRAQPTNDISASSQFGSQGVLNLVGLNVDPSRGAFQLPSGLTDASDRLDTFCTPDGGWTRSQFTLSGSGGLPESPLELRSTFSDLTEWATEKVGSAIAERGTGAALPTSYFSVPTSDFPLEADSMVIGPDGQVHLVATQPSTVELPPVNCDRLK